MFTIQLAVSFFVGGLFIALQTLIGERVSLRWRTIVLTIPSTTAIGLFFIGLSKTPADAAQAALFNSAAQGAAYVLATIFALTSSLGFIAGYFFSLIGWVAFAFLIVMFPPSTFPQAILIFAVPPVVIGYLITSRMRQIQNLKKFPMNFKHIFFRALFSGTIVTVSVFFAKTFGNIWGGISSTFPAVFSSTLIMYHYLNGPNVIPSVAKSFFFPGAIGFLLYVFVVSITFPVYGIWIGTLLAYGAYIALLVVWDIFGKEED